MTHPRAGRRMAGRVALVSGAARGQGRAHALRLAEEGAAVVAFDVCAPVAETPYPPPGPADLAETARLVEQRGGRVRATVADARDAAAVEELVADGVAAFGRLDAVVANAGVVAPAPAATLPEAVWDDVVATDLTGVWHTVRAALDPMLAAEPDARGRRGAIVLTSSANGGLKAPAHLAPYAAAKHALVGLARSLANELGPAGIRVNTVHPTAVDTVMIRNEATYRLFAPDVADPGPDDVAPVFARLHALPVPWIDVLDVANAVLWLLSDEARHVTGVALPVDAGLAVR